MRYALTTGNAGTPQAMTTTYKTLGSITAATGATTLRRAFLYEAMFGADGTPADNVMVYKIDRQTTVGTGTSATAAPLDAGDAATLVTGNLATTIEPTVTANTQLIEVGVNQRATYRWVASPDGALVMPATNVAGLGFRAKSPAYTGTVAAAIHFVE